MSSTTPEVTQPPFSPRQLIFLTIALGLGTFIQILDTSIANVSVPTIAGNLGVSADQGTWVITSFAVSNAVVLPLTGWLSLRFGQTRLFVLSTFLFSIASLLCGLSTSLSMLIFFRVVQGAVAGSLIPLSQGLLLSNFPPEGRGTALGLWSMVVIVAPILGPVLGGYITDNYGWPWIFYINVPIGFLSAWMTWELLSKRDTPTQKIPVDGIGLGLLIIGVATLQIMLDKGNDLDWFESNVINMLGITAVISLLYFCIWNYYSQHPVVDFSFFSDLNFSLGCFLSAITYAVFFGSMVILPLWLQTQMGYTAFWAGVAVMPIGIFPLILSPIVGKYMHLFDIRKVSTISFSIFGICFFFQSNFTTAVDMNSILQLRLIQGFGLAFYFLPLVNLTLSEIPVQSLASASGVFNFLRLLAGGGFGTSLFVNFWSRRATLHHSQLSEEIVTGRINTNLALEKLKAYGFSVQESYGILESMLSEQAYMLSTNDVFLLSGALFILLIPVVWFCRKPQAKEGQPVVAEG